MTKLALCLLLMLGCTPALAQTSLSDALALDADFSQRLLQIIATVTFISVIPAVLIMITCFPFLLTVLAVLRQGLGLQQSPPNMLLISLALFLTYFVMEPVFTEAWTEGIVPFNDGALSLEAAIDKAAAPFRIFMIARTDGETFSALADLRNLDPEIIEPQVAPLSLLIPSFMLSELTLAFQVGFLIYLPFLIIDLVVSAILMSMGMMMVPPAIVSLPFKLAFFVVSNGWTLIATSLVRGYL